MARLVPMEKLEERCVARADLQGDKHIEHAEWLSLISEAYGELFGVVAETGGRYFEAAETLTTDGTNVLAEPTDIQSLMGIFYKPSSGMPRLLHRITPLEYSRFSGGSSGVATHYETIDAEIRLYPTPAAGQTYEVRFIPQSPDLSVFASDNCVDCVVAEGEAYIIWAVALKAKGKREEDARLSIAERDRLLERVRDWAINRSLTEPKIVYADHSDDGGGHRHGRHDGNGRWGY